MTNTAADTAINPNTPVTSEPTVASKANSAVTFDDLDQMHDAEARAEKTKPAKKEAGKESKAAQPKTTPSGGRKTAEKHGEGDDGEPEASKPAVAKPDAAEKDDQRKEPKDTKQPRPKSHKYRSGDTEAEISSDSVFGVPIDGKKEDVSLQDLMSSYSGKVSYDRKFTELGQAKKQHEERVQKTDSMINGFLEKAKKNPEDGWDFLATFAGKDPVDLKVHLLREQRKEALDLAKMTDEEFEAHVRERTISWRERRYEQGETERKAQADQSEAERKVKSYQTDYGVSEDGYSKAAEIAKQGLKGEEPSPEQVIYVERYLAVDAAIKEVVPHLEKHQSFAKIRDDVVAEMLSHPKLSVEQVKQLLVEVWGEDKSPLKRVSRKVQDDDEAPRARQEPTKGATFFSELD